MSFLTNTQKHIDNLINGIKDYFVNNGPHSKAIIGISGGKDSTIAAALCTRALGADNVIGVIMPNGYQADIEDARKVCEILKIKSYEINIDKISGSFYESLLGPFDTIPENVYTNNPARIRMCVLYAVAAMVGGRVINTCNRSESYIGWETKFGDGAGDFAPLASYTTMELLEIGDRLSEIPQDLIHKVPSDGMCGSSDEEKFGFSYLTLDKYILDGEVPDYCTLRKIKEMRNRNVHKQIRIPTIIKWREEEFCF